MLLVDVMTAAIFRKLQFIVLVAGVLSITYGVFTDNRPRPNVNILTEPTGVPMINSSLRVTEPNQAPASVINQLQGASGLQNQSSESLQKPTGDSAIQPNAKSDSF